MAIHVVIQCFKAYLGVPPVEYQLSVRKEPWTWACCRFKKLKNIANGPIRGRAVDAQATEPLHQEANPLRVGGQAFQQGL